jgi:hypothetical protein
MVIMYQRSLAEGTKRVLLVGDGGPPHPATGGLALIVSGVGTVTAVLAAGISESPEVQAILFVGGICAALAGIAVLVRTIAKGAFWGVRAADGMGELMGDPGATPPVPGLGERMERMEATVDDVQRTLKGKVERDAARAEQDDERWSKVDQMHDRQSEMHDLLERLVSERYPDTIRPQES